MVLVFKVRRRANVENVVLSYMRGKVTNITTVHIVMGLANLKIKIAIDNLSIQTLPCLYNNDSSCNIVQLLSFCFESIESGILDLHHSLIPLTIALRFIKQTHWEAAAVISLRRNTVT